jgi:beta-aspartyl-peptidase (threonine type)
MEGRVRAILVHAGAGPHAGGNRPAKVAGTRRAAAAGWALLAGGGSALDAVEAAVREMEADPLFDAGVGSYLNRNGDVEVDAILVDGRTLAFGAVAGVPRVLHAVTLARRVLEDCPHSFLVGPAAELYARELGLTVPASELVTPETLARWRRENGAGAPDDPSGGTGDTGDTVGAVAVDGEGHVAAATSTGGTAYKWPGRVGDSPVIGSGAFADDESAAVSSTGHGESIMRVCLARLVAERVAAGDTPQRAAEHGVRVLGLRTGLGGPGALGQGGVIVVAPDGRLGLAFNTPAMPYAWQSDRGEGDGIA